MSNSSFDRAMTAKEDNMPGKPKSRAEVRKDKKKRALNKRRRAFTKMSSAKKRQFRKMARKNRRSSSRKMAMRTRMKTMKRTKGMKTPQSIRRALAASEEGHPADFIESLVLHVAEEPDSLDDVIDFLFLETDYTSTPLGYFAQMLSEEFLDDDNVAEAFIDVEPDVSEGMVFAYFTKEAGDNETSIKETLTAYGRASRVAEPGDDLGEGEQSAFYIFALKPRSSVVKESDEEFSWLGSLIVEDEDDDNDDDEDGVDESVFDDDEDDEDEDVEPDLSEKKKKKKLGHYSKSKAGYKKPDDDAYGDNDYGENEDDDDDESFIDDDEDKAPTRTSESELSGAALAGAAMRGAPKNIPARVDNDNDGIVTEDAAKEAINRLYSK